MFNVDTFNDLLNTSWLAQDFIYLNETDSTNSYLKKQHVERLCQGTLCITDNQRNGRGQYERSWTAEPFKNLTFTLVFKPSGNQRLHIISLACALACCNQIDQTVEAGTKIKWPNDVMYNGKKVGGLLTESVFCGNRLDKVLVGIGLNINQTDFPEHLTNATSLKNLNGKEDLSREQFLAALLQRIEHNYHLWNRYSLSLLKQINRTIIGYGEWRNIAICGEMLPNKFKILGINENGHLLTLSSTDELKVFRYEQVRILDA